MHEATARLLREQGVAAQVLRTRPDSQTQLTEPARAMLKTLEGPSGRSARLSPESYNLTISHERRFVWFRVAKVATRTVFDHCYRHGVPLDVVAARRVRYPITLMEDYTKFAFVRHPYTRFLSAWQDKVVVNNYFAFDDDERRRMQEPAAFLEWTARHDLSDLAEADQHIALQTRLVDLNQVDHLGRLESFTRDFAQVCEVIGLPAPQDTRINRSGGGEQPVDDALARAVHDVYRRDFQVLGYPAPA